MLKLSLRLKAVLGIICMSLIISATAIALSYRAYAATMDEHYMTLATNLAYTAAEMVDSDKIQQYVQTLTQDEAYAHQLEILRRVQSANQVECIYILEMRQTETCTIMDTDPEMEFGHVDPLVQPMAQEDDALVYISNTDSYGWLCSSMVWMRDASGHGYAVMCVDISMNEVMRDRMEFLRLVLLAILAAMAAACFVLSLLVNRFVVNPINQMAYAALQYVSDRRDSEGGVSAGTHRAVFEKDRGARSAIARLNIRTGDEIQDLSEAIQTMELEINEYIQDLTCVTAEKERIGAELNVATQIQADMLPRIFPAFPGRKEFDIYASMTPAKEVGGDFYDFFLVDDDHLAMVIADVSGKGVPAALFMVIAKTLLKNAVQMGLSPKAALEKVNNQLCENNEAEMFVTVWLGIYEISTGRLVAANAGHEYPAIRRAGGDFELFRDRHGFVLAGMENARYREYELEIGVGDTLFVYTDGVAEATDGANALYGTDRMLAALNQNCGLPPEKLLHQMKEDIDRFVGQAPQFDDITMLSFQRKEAASRQSLQVPPELDSIPRVCEFLERTLEERGAPMKVITQVNIAADEIVSNIARYSGATAVQVDCEVMEGRAVIRFVDDGRPYDPTAQPEPDITLSAEDREVGGLGIFMVKKSMDRVSYVYAERQNILTIEKRW